MYTTKLVHKGMVDNNAYITIGDPFHDAKPNPFRQPKKGEKAPTPFQSKMIPQNAENGNFSKITYQPDGYKETNKYITTQPLESRKRGFGTKDASRRDEFSNSIRTEQYREAMRKEKTMNAANSQALKDNLTRLLAERTMNEQAEMTRSGFGGTLGSGDFSYSDRVHQYDIGRTRVTPFNPKATKDRYYRFDDEREKRFGDSPKPQSYVVGESAWAVTYKPPVNGGKSETKNFFDKSHLGSTGI